MTREEERENVKALMLFWKEKWKMLEQVQSITLTRADRIKLHDTATQLHGISLFMAAEDNNASETEISKELLGQIKSILSDVITIPDIKSNTILQSRIKRILSKLN